MFKLYIKKQQTDSLHLSIDSLKANDNSKLQNQPCQTFQSIPWYPLVENREQGHRQRPSWLDPDRRVQALSSDRFSYRSERALARQTPVTTTRRQRNDVFKQSKRTLPSYQVVKFIKYTCR